jgi:signal transduction histidine kinase
MGMTAFLVGRVRNWFQPSDPDPRTRTLRYLSAALLMAALGSMLVSVLFYNDRSPIEIFWIVLSLLPHSGGLLKNVNEPILSTGIGAFHDTVYHRLSDLIWPLCEATVCLAGLAIGWLTAQRKLGAASLAVVYIFICLSGCVILFAYPSDLLFLPASMVDLLLISFLVSKRSIWLSFLSVFIINSLALQAQRILTGQGALEFDKVVIVYANAFFYLFIEALVVYAFRIEFEARANAWEKARLADLEKERLHELNRLKNEFLYSMSHELRTPLHSIIGLSSCILNGLDGEIDEEVFLDIETISNSGHHLLSLVNELLDLAKLEAGAVTLEFKPLTLVDLIVEAIRIVQPQAEGKGLTIVNNVSGDLPPLVADQRAIYQVLLNLLNNAIKFTTKGSIQLDAEVRDDTIIVCVKDSGIGIPHKDQTLIFNKFYQVEKKYTKQEIGLGLTISKRLIELHQGRIWVESVVNQGASFFFALPLSTQMEYFKH